MTRTLYIVGNGFDMHHRLETSYCAFGQFLSAIGHRAFGDLVSFAGLPEAPEDFDYSVLWSELEFRLGCVDREELIGHVDQYSGSPGDDRADGYFAAAREVMFFTDSMTSDLCEQLKQFILQVNYPWPPPFPPLRFDNDAVFLTFNYTKTLEHYYRVPAARVFAIHGSAHDSGDGSPIIFGHGADLEKLIVPPAKPPEGLTKDDYDLWCQDMNDSHNFATDNANTAIDDYYRQSRKEVQRHIQEFAHLWPMLAGVEDVVILGHSLSEVDIPYFVHVRNIVSPDCRWTCTFHLPREDDALFKRLYEIGIPGDRIRMLTMAAL